MLGHEAGTARSTLTSILVALAISFWEVPLPAAVPEGLPVRLDLGPRRSPVEAGFRGLSADHRYSSEPGFGWETANQSDFDVPGALPNPEWLGSSGQLIPEHYVVHKEHTNLTRDGTASTERLGPRIDVPDGKYLVRPVLGRLDRAACSMQVSLNGRVVASDVHARHFARRGAPDHLFGFPRVIRLPAEVHGGMLRIEIHGDDSAFRERFFREFNRPPPASYFVDVPTRSRNPVRPDLGAWGRDDATLRQT